MTGSVPRSPEPLLIDPIELARASWTSQRWHEAVDGMALVTSIMRVHQVLLARVERVLRPLGLTFARYEVLMLLTFTRKGSLPIGKVGERLQVHPASATNAVQRLEAHGYVRRIANPIDARSVLTEITARGRSLAEEATTKVNADVFSIVPLPLEQQREIYSVLRSMRKAFGDFR